MDSHEGGSIGEPSLNTASKLEAGNSENESSKEKIEVKRQSVPMRETHVLLPAFLGKERDMRFNMFTSSIGIGVLWGLAIYCMVDPENSFITLQALKTATGKYFTWFYIGANPAFTFFLFYLAYRYGNIKLGAKDDEVEFSNVSYFAMIFSSGVAAALFFYGVSEPLSHRSSHWYAESGYRSQDEIDQWALILTIYHWGFAGWSPYVIMAIASGLSTYRFGLPMTVRSGLYTLLGPYTWGWIGDVVDGFSMVTTVAGICTSLGVGVMQITAGLQRLGLIEYKTELMYEYVFIIWVVTLIATISVVSGLDVGIKLLSNLGFGLAIIMMTLVFFMEKSHYLLNLIVQTIGGYFQWSLFLIPFWTDAFGQLQEGEGRSPKGASDADWMDNWTVFYMAWWTAWACFVGLFIARISKGRTIRQVVVYCFVAPMIYSTLWFVIFGGAGLRQARQADEMVALGETYFGNPAHFQVEDSSICYNVPQESLQSTVDGVAKTIFTNTLPGVTPVCQYDAGNSLQAWFNVLYSFYGFGYFLSGISIFATIVFFVTSSDSGSLIVDHLASNGKMEHHWVQRVFWAFTEGAVATALLVSGGTNALGALQAAAIVFGLPFCLMLFLMCKSICTMCDFAEKNDSATSLPDPHYIVWKMPIFGGVFNIVEYIASGGSVHQERIDKGMNAPTSVQCVEFLKGLFIPFLSLYKVTSSMDLKEANKLSTILTTGVYTIMFFAWIVLFILGTNNGGFKAFGLTAFLLNGCILTNLRLNVREHFSIPGNIIGDFFASTVCYPQTMVQMVLQFEGSEKNVEE